MTRLPISACWMTALRADEAVAADRDRLADDRAGRDDGAAADLGARADHRARLDAHALFQLRIADARCPPRRCRPPEAPAGRSAVG